MGSMRRQAPFRAELAFSFSACGMLTHRPAGQKYKPTPCLLSGPSQLPLREFPKRFIPTPGLGHSQPISQVALCLNGSFPSWFPFKPQSKGSHEKMTRPVVHELGAFDHSHCPQLPGLYQGILKRGLSKGGGSRKLPDPKES